MVNICINVISRERIPVIDLAATNLILLVFPFQQDTTMYSTQLLPPTALATSWSPPPTTIPVPIPLEQTPQTVEFALEQTPQFVSKWSKNLMLCCNHNLLSDFLIHCMQLSPRSPHLQNSGSLFGFLLLLGFTKRMQELLFPL